MANYAQAFAEGLEAHRNAARAKAEIAEVLRTFSEQVSQASGGAIRGVDARSLSRDLPPGRYLRALVLSWHGARNTKLWS